jgi:S-DNA-T family DNA segregation ATPase FtsK/SpoIIIE
MGGRRQLLLALGFVACVLLLLALATHHPNDPAFSTSGNGEACATRPAARGLGGRFAVRLFGWSPGGWCR